MHNRTATNPFVVGRELGPDELADREDEVREVAAALTGAGRLFLLGPRRFGKTSVHHVATVAARRRGRVLRYNVEAFPDPEALVAAIVADAARVVAGSVARVAAALRDGFRALRPEVAFDPATGRWTVSFAAAPKAPTAVRLVEALDGLERLAARADRPVGVVLDEVQHLVQGGVAVEAQLRAAVQAHRHVGYVFAGSDTTLLAAMTGDPARPFYRLGTVRVLGPVPRAAFRPFLARGFRAARGTVEPAALDAILDLADDVPYNVQLLAHACWDALQGGGPRPRLTAARAAEVHAAQARALDPVYSQQWVALTAPQRVALHATVLTRGDGLYGEPARTRWGLSASAMQRAVGGLVDKQVLRRETAAGAARLRVEDPLFAEWVRRTVGAPG